MTDTERNITAKLIEQDPYTSWAGKQTEYLETVDSTNSYVLEKAAQGAAHGFLAAAREQTSGRGRMGREWMMPAGQAVAMSILVRPQLPMAKVPMLTLAAGLAAVQAIERISGLSVGIKWPNDIVYRGRKVCGILAEGAPDDAAVIGIGINTNVAKFPPELLDRATSLLVECGRRIEDNELIRAFLEELESCYFLFMQTQDLSLLMEDYESYLVNRNQQVRVLEPGNEYSGIALGITRTGELIVETEDGERKEIGSGEVSVRGIYGYAGDGRREQPLTDCPDILLRDPDEEAEEEPSGGYWGDAESRIDWDAIDRDAEEDNEEADTDVPDDAVVMLDFFSKGRTRS